MATTDLSGDKVAAFRHEMFVEIGFTDADAWLLSLRAASTASA